MTDKQRQIIKSAKAQCPYKQVGNPDSYSDFNQGWESACYAILEAMEADKQTFESVSRPVMKWLSENKNPHSTIIITSTTSELVEGVMSVNTDDYITD
jgi:hypothetical protein